MVVILLQKSMPAKLFWQAFKLNGINCYPLLKSKILVKTHISYDIVLRVIFYGWCNWVNATWKFKNCNFETKFG